MCPMGHENVSNSSVVKRWVSRKLDRFIFLQKAGPIRQNLCRHSKGHQESLKVNVLSRDQSHRVGGSIARPMGHENVTNSSVVKSRVSIQMDRC